MDIPVQLHRIAYSLMAKKFRFFVSPKQSGFMPFEIEIASSNQPAATRAAEAMFDKTKWSVTWIGNRA